MVTDSSIKAFCAEVINIGSTLVPGKVFYINEAGHIHLVENLSEPKRKKDRQLLTPRLPAKGLSILQEWVYYYNEDTLAKINFDGGENQSLAQIPPDSLVWIYPVFAGGNVENTWIYYYVMKTNAPPKLYKVRSNGLENSPVL